MKLYIGEQLKALRKEKQITQEALAFKDAILF